MKISTKIFGMLLVAVLVAALFVSSSAAISPVTASTSAAPVEQSFGCHARAAGATPDDSRHTLPFDSQIPQPAPGKHQHQPQHQRQHQCCLTGHDVAVVRASQSRQPSGQCTHVTLQSEYAPDLYLLGAPKTSIEFADSPGASPLRI